jgi:hypothetical protein
LNEPKLILTGTRGKAIRIARDVMADIKPNLKYTFLNIPQIPIIVTLSYKRSEEGDMRSSLPSSV